MRYCWKAGVATAVLALASFSAGATDVAILRNGFAIRHERREARDTLTRLYLSEAPNNYVDVPVDDIISIEKLELPEPAVPAPSPNVSSPRAPVADLNEVIGAASSRNNIDPDLVRSLIRAESGFNPKAISPKGAQGLMQLMPQTAAQLGVEDPLDPGANVEGGTRYLKTLLGLYNNDLIKALAAYNAGPQRVTQYRGVPPYSETRTYVARVLSDFHRKKLAQQDRGRRRETVQSAKHPAPGPREQSSAALGPYAP